MRNQRGFALMLAVFLIVTLAAIGVYLVTITTGQIEAATQDERGARAYQAARAGVDWGAYKILRNGSAGLACAAPPGASQTLTLQQGLTDFIAVVNCQQLASETEGGSTVVIRRLEVTGCSKLAPASTACCLAGTACGPTYVERQLKLTLTE
jgi:MSHA biogenesis protein MshP